MSRDGGGVYSIPAGSVFADATVIDEVVMNALIADIAADLNVDRPIVAGGTGASTAAAALTALGGEPPLLAIDTTGSSNAYILATARSLTPSNGDAILIVANHANDGASTIDVDGTGAVDIKKVLNGTPTALVTGGIYSGSHYLLVFDSSASAWMILNHEIQVGVTTGVSGADLTLITGTAGTTNFTAKWDANGDLIDGFEVLDEDDMSSDSATALVTQQSAKAYADTKLSLTLTTASPIATTSGTTHDFTIVAGARRITVTTDGVSGSGTGEIGVQFGDAGGIEATEYLSTLFQSGGGSANDVTTRFQLSKSPGSGDTMDSSAIFIRHGGNKWKMQGNVGNLTISGSKELSAELTTVRLMITSGTFDAGEVTVHVET